MAIEKLAGRVLRGFSRIFPTDGGSEAPGFIDLDTISPVADVSRIAERGILVPYTGTTTHLAGNTQRHDIATEDIAASVDKLAAESDIWLISHGILVNTPGNFTSAMVRYRPSVTFTPTTATQNQLVQRWSGAYTDAELIVGEGYPGAPSTEKQPVSLPLMIRCDDSAELGVVVVSSGALVARYIASFYVTPRYGTPPSMA